MVVIQSLIDYEQKIKGEQICGGIMIDIERIIFGLRFLKNIGQKKMIFKFEYVFDYIVKMIYDFFFFVYINFKVSFSRVKK